MSGLEVIWSSATARWRLQFDEPARPPVDPRLKVLKKFRGRFLPRGPLRDRLKALMTRWDSGEDHGGVTVEELKTLHGDWKASREKKSKKPAQV